MNIFRCLDDIRNGPSKNDKGEDVTQTWFVFLQLVEGVEVETTARALAGIRLWLACVLEPKLG